MNKMIVQLLLGTTVLLSSLHAFLTPAPGQLVFSGAYNYVDPRFAASPFVIETIGPGSAVPNKRFSNNFDTKGLSGAEVLGKFGITETGTSYLSADWKTLQGSDVAQSGSLGAAIFVPVVIPPLTPNPITSPFSGTARSTLRLCHNDVSLSWNCLLNITTPFTIYVGGGVEYLQFNSDDTVVYISTTDARTYSNQLKTDVHGLGFKMSTDILYTLYAPGDGQSEMSLHLGLSATPTVSQNKAKFNYAESGAGGVSFDLSSERYTRIVPKSDAKIGLNYVRYFLRWVLALEIGYDVTTYPNLIDTTTFTSQFAGDQNRLFDNFGTLAFQGLFVDLSVKY